MMWVIAAGLLGFATGLFAFRVKSRWCPECGANTVTLLGSRSSDGAVR